MTRFKMFTVNKDGDFVAVNADRVVWVEARFADRPDYTDVEGRELFKVRSRLHMDDGTVLNVELDVEDVATALGEAENGR